MRHTATILVLPFALALSLAAQERVVIETELGTVKVELDLERAPLTAANFLRYVDGGLYDGATFYRTVHEGNQPDDRIRIAVIQGGLGDAAEHRALPPISMESTRKTGLRHLNGTISMARLGPDTAAGEFFICVGDQVELDEGGRRNPDGFGFAAFGRVVAGLEVVERIHRSPFSEQPLTPAITIRRAWRASVKAP